METLYAPFRSLFINIFNSFLSLIITIYLLWVKRKQLCSSLSEVSKKVRCYAEEKCAFRRFVKKHKNTHTPDSESGKGISKARERLMKFSASHSSLNMNESPKIKSKSDPKKVTNETPSTPLLNKNVPVSLRIPPRSPKSFRAPPPPPLPWPLAPQQLHVNAISELSSIEDRPYGEPSAPSPENPFIADFEIFNEANELYPCLAISRPKRTSSSSGRVAYKVHKYI